ncbi:hypothetical protein CBW46_017140 [Paenibacillus xerothermodurans]|uniref:Uncharacterized protein n=1 Tax=Paenibacillus xerothermodurans TaxID=1977292 RepID=A0A2W1NJS8_PAEXE|nr:hypothetical protein CBW46_017140 [Paenibacillus xerothermodurans]
MQTERVTAVSIPYPSLWSIRADIAGRPIVWGTLVINSVRNGVVDGTVNFRGRPIPIRGHWDESSKRIAFDSPYATFAGSLIVVDEQAMPLRHFVLRGRFRMKPPSLQAGETGTWLAATDVTRQLTGKASQ